MVNSICNSSDEKITEEKRNLGDDQCRTVEDEGEVTELTLRSSRTSSQ